MFDNAASWLSAAAQWARTWRTGSRPAQAQGVAASAKAAEREPGSWIAGYRIERCIGHGSSGAVYAALDPATNAPLAIKTVALDADDDAAAVRERFLLEASLASRLEHPDIVAVYGAGEEHGTGFIVMELATGVDLTRYTRFARLLPEPVALRVVERVCEALAYAHRSGVVHRDVKPANVIVDLPRHTLKVTDFGLARTSGGSRTRSGFVLGTPAFMSPEQLAGAEVDGRTDLYAAGVMLFQLLTGRLPYEAASMGALLRAIAVEEPLRLAAVRPELPAALSDAIDRAIQKRRDDRYRDAADMAADLRKIEAGWDAAQYVTARPR